MFTTHRTFARALVALLLAGPLVGCVSSETPVGGPGELEIVQGQLQQAGSSTVLPVAEAWAEELAPFGLQVVVSGGGSGAGASKLCAGEIDIGDMSRELKASEVEDCRANGVEPVVWEVAFDGLTVVVPHGNAWVDFLTVAELAHIWRSDDPARTWADVREGWPAERIRLFGPDSDSGTYEYFNEVILDEKAPRSDYTPSADDNVLVEGVASSTYAIGHFGYAYFVENEGRLRAVPIQAEDAGEAVAPSPETIADGSYAPLSRPLFMVTDGEPEPGTPIHSYFLYGLTEGQALVSEVGYIALDQATLDEQLERL